MQFIYCLVNLVVLVINFHGICYNKNLSGGYYGSSHIEFSKGDPTMEIITDRELGFFAGTAVGPHYPGYSYLDNSGERVVQVTKPSAQTNDSNSYNSDNSFNFDACNNRFSSSTHVPVYYNGGCSFVSGDADVSNCEVLWEYEDHGSGSGTGSERAAVVGCKVGSGFAVLSGVHPEVGFADLDNSQHMSSVIREMKEQDSERQIVLKSIFSFVEGLN